jgi:ABC-type Mn2+/Zn2+ transport system ATPase subunit
VTGASEPLVRVEGASVGWGRRVVLRDVSLQLGAGDCLGLVGRNGSGKTTLLRALLGLARPLAGEVTRSAAWRAGYVPQLETLEPLLRLRADEVVAMGAEPAAWLPLTRLGARREAARRALDAVDMAAFARRVFRELSGGQRQRVLIARALASVPSVLVLDEPTQGLDVRAEREVLDLVRALREERGLAIVLVSHAIHVVRREARHAGLVAAGRVRFGEPEDVLAGEAVAAVYDGESAA